MQLDLGGMLTALEKKQHSQNAKQSSRPVVFSGKRLHLRRVVQGHFQVGHSVTTLSCNQRLGFFVISLIYN